MRSRFGAVVAVAATAWFCAPATAQQRILEDGSGLRATVVGISNSQPFILVNTQYNQCLSPWTSKVGQDWAIGAISKAPASRSLGPDGIPGTADDVPTTFNSVRNTVGLNNGGVGTGTLSLDAKTETSTFYGAVSFSEITTDYPAGQGWDQQHTMGMRVRLGLDVSNDPNTVEVRRTLVATDKTDAANPSGFEYSIQFVHASTSQDGTVSGRADWGSGAPQAVWSISMDSVAASEIPVRILRSNYQTLPETDLTLPGGQTLQGPQIDQYDPDFVSSATFARSVEWTDDGGATQRVTGAAAPPCTNTTTLLGTFDPDPPGADTRGTPGMSSDFRSTQDSHGLQAVLYRPEGGLPSDTPGRYDTIGVLLYEMDDCGIIPSTHRRNLFGGMGRTVYHCGENGVWESKSGDDVAFTNLDGTHYFGATAFRGPYGTIAVNGSGNVVIPVVYDSTFFELEPRSGAQQALLWSNAMAETPTYYIVAYHGQAWDPANCYTLDGFGDPNPETPGDQVPWILGDATATSVANFPDTHVSFSNPVLDEYNNVFFIVPFDDRRDDNADNNPAALFRAIADDPDDPHCWQIDMIVEEFDRWTDCNGVETTITNISADGGTSNSVGPFGLTMATQSPAVGTIGSNALVKGLLPGVDAQTLDPQSPASSGGLIFNGTALIDETPAHSGTLAEVACNDNSDDCGGGSLQSSLSVAVQSGVTYLIEVTALGFDGTGGDLDFSLACNGGGTSGGAQIAADECADATVIPIGGSAFNPPLQDTTDDTLAESDPLQSCTTLFEGGTGGRRNSHSVWYSYTPSSNCTLTVNTCGSDYDTVLTVYTGACGDDGLITKGKAANVTNGGGGGPFVLTDAAADFVTAGVPLRSSVEIISGTGVTTGFYEITARTATTLTLNANPGNSMAAGDVVYQINDNEFFTQVFYVKAFQEAAPEPGCVCGELAATPNNAVDLSDFGAFAVCFGADVLAQPECECSDLNADGQVNGSDFATFATIFSLTPDGVTVPDCLSVD